MFSVFDRETGVSGIAEAVSLFGPTLHLPTSAQSRSSHYFMIFEWGSFVSEIHPSLTEAVKDEKSKEYWNVGTADYAIAAHGCDG